jgi:hypothetical protein
MRERRSKHEPHDPEWHLADPRTKKWMVQCSACGTVGYRSDAPQRFFGRAHLVAHFEPLDLDSNGRCSLCATAVET